MNERYRIFLIACFGTVIGFGGLGALLIYYHNGINPLELMKAGRSPGLQLLLGLGYGALSTSAIILIMSVDKMKGEYEYYQKLIRQLLPEDLNFFQILFLSFCAGFGEELFFRGYLQYHWGIWITAAFFVAIHGYLNPTRPIFFYGLFMIVDIAGLGWLYENYGFISAATAHMAIDFILIYKMCVTSGSSGQRPENE